MQIVVGSSRLRSRRVQRKLGNRDVCILTFLLLMPSLQFLVGSDLLAMKWTFDVGILLVIAMGPALLAIAVSCVVNLIMVCRACLLA